ncbi:histone H4 transcription factor-like [Platysternon megacephalum]|uniref:Histone H4 transcription factor-like n=1 Tax=Platysternon megacephalum TaxID=55544 RepID=A0A4D9E236_9SAUR|nr:histone H4 transcription factor-like [Platysternon megacephalum]
MILLAGKMKNPFPKGGIITIDCVSPVIQINRFLFFNVGKTDCISCFLLADTGEKRSQVKPWVAEHETAIPVSRASPRTVTHKGDRRGEKLYFEELWDRGNAGSVTSPSQPGQKKQRNASLVFIYSLGHSVRRP